MAYQINFETAEGTVEHFSTERTIAGARKVAKLAARTSAMNAVYGVTRWLIERADQTVETFNVGG